MTAAARGAPGVADHDGAATPPTPPRATYRPHVDGLRAVAVTIVVAFHAGVPGFGGGFVGVDVFFVISGYLIIAMLVAELERTGRIDLVAFWARRVRRLVPAALTVTLATLAVGTLVLDPLGTLQSTTKAAVAATAMVANLFFWKGEPLTYFGDHQPSPLLHTWSLSLEEQFYVLAALGLLLVWWVARRTGRASRGTVVVVLAAVAIVSVATSVWITAKAPSMAFYLPPTRAYEFIAGGLLALCALPGHRLTRLVAHPIGGLVGVVGIAVVTVVALPADQFPGAWALAPVAATVLLIASGHADDDARRPVARVLSSAPMVWVGRRSYSWYLWHWPVLVLAQAWNLGQLPLWARLLCAVASLGLADLSFRFVETPFRRPRRPGPHQRVEARAGRTVLVGVVASALVVGVALGATAGARQLRQSGPWPAIEAAELDTPTIPDRCDDALVEVDPPPGLACWITGSADADGPALVLWGDSHAWHLVGGLAAAAREADVDLVAIVRGGCPPYDPSRATRRFDAGETFNASCDRSNAVAIDEIEALAAERPVTVVTSARWDVYLDRRPIPMADRVPTVEDLLQGYDGRLTGLGPALAGLHDEGARSALVLSTPEFDRPVPECVAAPLRPFTCDVARERIEAFREPSTRWLEDDVAPVGDSEVIDLLPMLCGETRCPPDHDGIAAYFDDDHLSEGRSITLAPAYAAVVDELARRAADTG